MSTSLYYRMRKLLNLPVEYLSRLFIPTGEVVVAVELTADVPGHLRLAVQRISNSILVLSHDAEHILIALHQVLYRPHTLLGFVGHLDPGLPVGHTPPDHVVGYLGASVVFRRQPGQSDILLSNLLELDGSRGCSGAA